MYKVVMRRSLPKEKPIAAGGRVQRAPAGELRRSSCGKALHLDWRAWERF